MYDNGKMPNEGSSCVFLSIILIYSVLKKDKKLYAQVFLKECKNRKIVKKYIKNSLESSSHEEISDKESFDL